MQFAQQQLSAGGISDAASRDAAFRRAYVQAGLPLDLSGAASALGLQSGDLSSIIDPTTQQLAQENTKAGLSTQARLDQTHKDAITSIKNALNARGLLNSGETGYQLNKEQQNYTQAEYDSTAKLTDYLASYQQGYLQAENQRQAQLAQAASDAANRQIGLAQNQPSGGTTATFAGTDPATGNPFYRAPDGTLHNPDGSIYIPSQAPSHSSQVFSGPTTGQATGGVAGHGIGQYQS